MLRAVVGRLHKLKVCYECPAAAMAWQLFSEEREREKVREGGREGQRDRETERRRATERQRETETEKETETDRDTERETDRQREGGGGRERESVYGKNQKEQLRREPAKGSSACGTCLHMNQSDMGEIKQSTGASGTPRSCRAANAHRVLTPCLP